MKSFARHSPHLIFVGVGLWILVATVIHNAVSDEEISESLLKSGREYHINYIIRSTLCINFFDRAKKIFYNNRNNIYGNNMKTDWKQILNQLREINQRIIINENNLNDVKCKLREHVNSITATNSQVIKQAQTLIVEINQIIKNICIVHKEFVLSEYELTFSGISYSCYPYDPLNLTKVYSCQKKNCHDAIKEVLSSNFGSVNLVAEKLCKSYNTLLKISSETLYPPSFDKFPTENEKLNQYEIDLAKLKLEKSALIDEMKNFDYSLFENCCEFKKTDTYDETISLFLATLTENGNNIKIPLIWNLNNEGAILINVEKAALCDKFYDFLKSLILHAMYCYPVNAKRILICDKTSDDNLLSFYGAFKDSLPSLCLHPKSPLTENDDASISHSLEELDNLISHRISLLGKADKPDILAYNAANIDNIQPLIFTVLFGYPYGYANSSQYLTRIFKNSKRAGVFFIIISSDAFPQCNEWGKSTLPDTENFNFHRSDFTIKDGKAILSENYLNYECVISKAEIENAINELKDALGEESAILSIDSIIPKEDFESSSRRKDFSKVLSIPIGKSESKPLILNLDSENDAHAVISGTTGSGKSSLLNTLIISLATLYSPTEVEINLISMVKSEFNAYKQLELPHLKTIVTKNDIVGAVDVLNYLQDLMQSRMNTIGSDIVSYNASVPKEKQIPRTVIIIDEYQRLITDEDGVSIDAALTRMRTIAQLGRSCGISLILSSQVVPTGFRNDLSLFRHTFEFKSSSLGNLIPEVAYRKNELEGMAGLCFYSRGEQIKLGRIAFVGKTDSQEFALKINAIKNKFPSEFMHLNSDIKKLVPSDISLLPYLTSNPKRDYKENGIIRIRLGLKYLSEVPMEFQLSYKNNVLQICGEYLLTKNIETAIIKDVLALSEGENLHTVYYIDLNRNINWSRKQTIVKEMRDYWLTETQGRFIYFSVNQFADALESLETLCSQRENTESDEELNISPVTAIITCCEQIDRDSDEYYRFESLLGRGKNCNIFFVLQFNEYLRYPFDVITNAILLPDRCNEGEVHSSSVLLDFLSHTQAAENGAKELMHTLIKKPLDSRLNLICINNEAVCFMPYIYDKNSLKK